MSDRRNPNSRVKWCDKCDHRHDLAGECPVPRVVRAKKEVDRLMVDFDDTMRAVAAARLRTQQVRLDRTASNEDMMGAAQSYRSLEARMAQVLEALADAHVNVMLSIAESKSDASERG